MDSAYSSATTQNGRRHSSTTGKKEINGSLDILANRISQLRELFEHEYNDNSQCYDKKDYDRFMDDRDDWYARRWIIYQRDPNIAYEMVKDTLRWRKDMGLNDLKYEDFPREFYECGCVFEYGRDKKGRCVMYVRCRLFKPMAELTEIYDKFFAFMIDQCDKRSGPLGFSLVFDVTDAGLSNVEMSTIRFMTSLRDRFPLASKQILVAGLPWVLKPIFAIVMSLIPASQAEAFKLISTLAELNQYIDENQTPSKLGGTSKSKFQLVPRKTRDAKDFENIPSNVAAKLRKHVDSKTDKNDIELVDGLRVLH